jgi:hypothetical protein
MIVAFSVYTYRNVFLQHCFLTRLGILLLLVEVSYNFYTPLAQKWPRDFYDHVVKKYGEVYRAVSVLGPSVINQVALDPGKKLWWY